MDCAKESTEDVCKRALDDLVRRVSELEKESNEKSGYIKRLESAIDNARSQVFDPKPDCGAKEV